MEHTFRNSRNNFACSAIGITLIIYIIYFLFPHFLNKFPAPMMAALAEKADISITFLSKIERGIKYPTSETISGIANGLGVELCDLFRQDETPADHTNMLERLQSDVLQTVETVFNAYKGR